MEEVRVGRKVMVAVDGTEQSMYALQWALDHLITPGESVGSDKLILMHAEILALSKTPHRPWQSISAVAFTGHVLDILERREATETLKILARARSICEKRNILVESTVIEGEAQQAICEAAKRMRVDLLVVGGSDWGSVDNF